MDNDKLIDAANARAAMYDGDDRQDIKTDVMNAFFAGAKFGATVEREACASRWEAAHGFDKDGVAKWLRSNAALTRLAEGQSGVAQRSES